MITLISILLWAIPFLQSCESPSNAGTTGLPGYNLRQPAFNYILPDTLHEVSGITAIDHNTLACVQDENGILFIYDIAKNSVKQQIPFHVNGDYEGIARVDNDMYVLRSDGMLFQLKNYSSPTAHVESFVTGVPADNNEGLCYDADNNRLLIGCKSKIGKGKEFKDKRVVYAFDLKTKRLGDTALYEFDVNTMKEFAKANHILFPTREKKDKEEPIIKFRTSAIAIHPITKQLYVLSASDHSLFVFNKDGSLAQMTLLDSYTFNKSEGIAFLDNGDMLITNEGQDKKPTLLRFDYKN